MIKRVELIQLGVVLDSRHPPLNRTDTHVWIGYHAVCVEFLDLFVERGDGSLTKLLVLLQRLGTTGEHCNETNAGNDSIHHVLTLSPSAGAAGALLVGICGADAGRMRRLVRLSDFRGVILEVARNGAYANGHDLSG